MAILSKLRPAKGSKRGMKRLGRGDGSGHGGTSTMGHKGQLARSSSDVSRGFEGGQMPIHRRSPKWGFTNSTQIKFAGVNVDSISQKFKAGEAVTPESLKAKGLIQRSSDPVKILGRGKLAHALTISAHAVSASAKAAIEGAKGSVKILERKATATAK